MPKQVIISGGSGLVGTALVEHFAQRGWQVVALVRKPAKSKHANVQYAPYDLTKPVDLMAYKRADLLIHAAYIKYDHQNAGSPDENIEGAKRIIKACRKADIKKSIFISSMSARPDALSHYGRQKYAIEQLFDGKNDIIIRPGLVIGRGGLIQQTVNLMHSLHVLPLIAGGKQPIQVIAVADLAKAIEQATHLEHGTFTIAHPEKHDYVGVYKAIARALSIKVLFVPVPFWLMLLLVRSARMFGVSIGVGEDNLLGLKKLTYTDTHADLKKVHLTPLPLKAILKDPAGLDIKRGRGLLQDNRVKYVFSGALSFGIEFLAFIVLLAITNQLITANSISFCLGVLTGFALHKLWSFAGDHTLKTSYQITIYFVLATINLLFTNTLIVQLTGPLQLAPWFAKTITIAFIVIWNYLLYKFIIFRHRA